MDVFDPLFFISFWFILFYLISVETTAALKFKVPFKFVFSSNFTYKDPEIFSLLLLCNDLVLTEVELPSFCHVLCSSFNLIQNKCHSNIYSPVLSKGLGDQARAG